MNQSKLSAERARELLAYDPETGVLTWRVSKGRAKAGSRVQGRQVEVDGSAYLGHRLCWLLHFGVWPTNLIDHINGDPSDNRLANLRDATRECNAENRRRARSGSKSGFLGVSPAGVKFQARIHARGRSVYLGVFSKPEEAHQAYLTAKRSLHAGCTI